MLEIAGGIILAVVIIVTAPFWIPAALVLLAIAAALAVAAIVIGFCIAYPLAPWIVVPAVAWGGWTVHQSYADDQLDTRAWLDAAREKNFELYSLLKEWDAGGDEWIERRPHIRRNLLAS